MERILGGLPMTQPLSDIPPVEEPILGGDVRSIFRPDETKLDKAKGLADAGLSLFGALVHGVPAQFMGKMGPEFQAKRFRPPQTPAGERYFETAAEALGKVAEAFPMQPTAFTSPANVLAAPAMAQAGAKAADVNAMAQRALQAAGGRLEKAVEKQVYSTMEKGGLPAEILQGMTEGTRSYMAQPQRVEAPRNELKLYSPAEEAALNLQRGQGRGEGFLNDLRKAGVRDEELEYTGLKDFLAGKQNVSKKEIQDYLAGNKVQISETQLGGLENETFKQQVKSAGELAASKQQEIQNLLRGKLKDLDYYNLRDFWARSAASGNESDLNKIKSLNLDPETEAKVLDYGKAVEEYTALKEQAAEKRGENPKYSQYTLPGGENYREILLTLPVKQKGEFPPGYKLVDESEEARALGMNIPEGETGPWRFDGPNVQSRSFRTRDEALAALRRDAQLEEEQGVGLANYRSSHWDQPNVLAHLRVNDRVDADGKKMLLIEEIQSDWHQAGREKGYNRLPEGAEVVQNKFGDNFMVRMPNGNLIGAGGRTREEAIQSAIAHHGAVPDAPFKEDWYQLALKRALQEAVDKGYDRVGLLTGKRQIERYPEAMRQVVNKIDVEAVESVPNLFFVDVDVKQGKPLNLEVENGIVRNSEYSQLQGKSLREIFGKDLADKIVSTKRGETQQLTGEDFTIGGEGMKKYYDEIYPGFLNKYGKKFDAKVGETTLKLTEGVPHKGISGESEPVRYIDITPKMKEALSKGQPMFKEGGLVSSDAISPEVSLPDDPFRSGRPLLQRTRRPATQEENEALNRAVLQGAANMPYNLVGAPADIGNLLLTPLGLGSEQPVLSSDWIKQKMTDLGVRPEAPTDPTQRALYSAADIGSSLVNPAAPVRAIASGAERASAAIGREIAPKAGEMVEDLLRKQGLLLDAAPPGKSPQIVSIYHGGNTGLEEIKGGVGPGNIFGGIFGSQDRRVAASHGDGSVYRIDLPKDEILSQQMLDSMDQVELTGALKKAMPWLKKEDVDDAFRAVIDDKAHKVSDDSLMRIFREDSPGEAGWEAQRIRGEVARLLGKKAVEMADEHGVSYLILPGAKPILDVDKKAESGLVSNTDTIKARLIEQGMPEDKAFMQALKLANEKQMADGVPANVQRQLNEPLIVEEPLSANARSGALPGQQRITPAKSTSAIDDGAGSVESVQFVKLPDGRFATSTAFQQTRSVAVGFDQASTPGQAAHITAGLRKSPQEQLVAVVLDENDRPIQIIRHTVGLASQASAEPFSLLGAIANTPKAKSFWISHNHPSGNPELSLADKNLANAINNISRGTGIEMRGILAIGKSKYAAYSPDGSIDISNNSIPAAARTKSIDMVERTFRKANLLDSTKIQTPAQARDVAQKIAGDETGLILFNSAYQPVAFVPLTNINVGALRQTGVAKQLLGSLEKANATATMYVSKSNQNIAELPNLAKMLEQARSPMIDALVGDKLESLAMANKLPTQSVDFKSVLPIAGAATGAAMMGLENDKGMAKGGLAGLKNLPAAARAAKAVKPVEVLPPEESQANLGRFLESSKVRERLYHATPKNFSEFKPGGEDPTLSGPAMWFSTDPQKQPAMHNISGGREGQFREGVNVMPVYVQAKNPLVLDDPVMLDWAQTVFAGGSREFPELLAPKWVEEIRKEGYDSIIFADPYGKGRTQEVIMFQPEKIKSAIGNRGTYDQKSRDITKRQGGLAAMNRN